MTCEQQLLEVAQIGVILGDHFAEKLYKKMQEHGTGYVSTFEQIGCWAVEFFKKHKNTNWEEALENELEPLSNEMTSINCFDDAVIDFGHYKLSHFNK